MPAYRYVVIVAFFLVLGACSGEVDPVHGETDDTGFARDTEGEGEMDGGDSDQGGAGDAGSGEESDAGSSGEMGQGDTGGDVAGPPPADECEDWRTTHPAWIWCDGFEEEAGWKDGYGDVNDDDGKFAPSTNDAFTGSRSLEQLYTSGQVGAGWLGLHLGDAPGSDGEPARDHYFVRWYHKFESGFEGAPPKMARVRRLSPSWDKEYGVHHWVAGDELLIVADVFAPDSTQANSAGWLAVARSDFSYAAPANIGRWICHEMEIENNTPGQADGLYRVWADGEKIIERTDVDLRGSRQDADLNEIMLDTYWNGGSPKEQSRFYDNFVVSTERIGCL